MKVGDIQHLLVKEPAVIGPKQSIKDLLAGILMIREHGSELTIGNLANFEAETVQDLMNENPHFVKESTSLSDMANILIQQKNNEFPIVNDDMRLVGQVNVYEMIMAYLKEKQ
jgi:predicted transcriptional regulator